MVKDRFVTKTLHKTTKKIHEEVFVCSIKKERKKSHFQFSIKKLLSKNGRNLPSILFKSQYDTFQWLMATHSLVTGARGGEAQHWGDPKTKPGGRGDPLQTPKITLHPFETTRHIHWPRGRGFLQSNTHYQFTIKNLFMIWSWLSKERMEEISLVFCLNPSTTRFSD